MATNDPRGKVSQIGLTVAIRKICDDAVASFKVTPFDKEQFLARKLQELKAIGGGQLTPASVGVLEREVRDMVPIVNGEPIRQPIPAGIPGDILQAGKPIARVAGAASEQLLGDGGGASTKPESPGAYDDARPDWTFYCALPHATISQAVILSLDLIPAVLERLLPEPIRMEYSRRCVIAIAALQVGDLRPAIQTSRLGHDTSVRLPKFVEWAVSPPRNLSLPVGFRALLPPQAEALSAPARTANQVNSPPEDLGREVGTRERNKLLVIIGALIRAANLDKLTVSGAADKIEAITADMRAPIPKRSIIDVVNGVRDAVAARQKP